MKAFLRFTVLLLALLMLSCHQPHEKNEPPVLWESYDEFQEIADQQSHELPRMQFKLIQSKLLDKNEVFRPLYNDVSAFSESRYLEIYPLIMEQDIPTIQLHISKGKFTYEELTLFFLKRIYKYELDPAFSLHTIIALNRNVLEQARARDKNKLENSHPIYGMPILLKDNINTRGINASAGAAILKESTAGKEAFLVTELEKKGALILGKVNLSEWAYYFCTGCPLGYSAVGGQTLNPYGRKVFETGGSSAGSGTSVAANYAVAAVGTETSGSIISPSSQNSVVGLKPTIGVISRSGLVPISHTLDTPGPMTKNVIDNAILLDAMAGKDTKDTITVVKRQSYLIARVNSGLKGKRLGVMKSLLKDSIYATTVKKLEKEGAILIEYNPPEISLDGFLSVLNLEMKADLPIYLAAYTTINDSIKTLSDVMAYNAKDSLIRMPYHQGVFDRIMIDSTSSEQLTEIRANLLKNGTAFFQQPMVEYKLDAILSINNYHSAAAAVGLHPCLTVPMGYKPSGEPISLTLIGSPFSEQSLLSMGYSIEKSLNARRIPEAYKD
ncbi:amidase [Ulvibacter sp. MAR_2010_11]|uniref:amidase family protein n=1 Tax=Ulvibacter sp. MAR_2010_11 TaxID=1250229 RepID=UPI000C2BAAF8|nr:amidase family protein [Ulvibacter sp. MAR_2010_11]PKA82408.1 amidase [Ulvibacter sp. MAR_2010_11]